MTKIMTKEDLEQLGQFNFLKDSTPPLLDEIYIVSCVEKFDNGFNVIQVYGVAFDVHGEITWAKRMGDYTDVIHVKADPGITSLFSIDITEPNVARYFARQNCKFEINSVYGEIEILIVEQKNK